MVGSLVMFNHKYYEIGPRTEDGRVTYWQTRQGRKTGNTRYATADSKRGTLGFSVWLQAKH